MEDRLNSKIKELNKMAKLYEGLVKKDYDYQYRLDAIYSQLEVLEELKSGNDSIIEKWKVCYREDLKN